MGSQVYSRGLVSVMDLSTPSPPIVQGSADSTCRRSRRAFGYAFLLETVCVAASVEVLLIVAGDVRTRAITALDSVTIIVAGTAVVLQCFRLMILGGIIRTAEQRPNVMLLTGSYLVLLWAVLHFSIVIAEPDRLIYMMVGTTILLLVPRELIKSGTDRGICWVHRSDHQRAFSGGLWKRKLTIPRG